MKRFFSCLLACALLLTSLWMLFSCTASLNQAEIHIVSVNFAAYDFATEIAGRDNERVSVELLSGGDAHSFNPTFNDIAKIQSCDLFLYAGGESDSAVDTLLASCGEVNTLKLIDCVSLLKEDDREAYEQEEEDAHAEGEHEHGYDEHVWTSLANAVVLVDAITEALVACDPSYETLYRENAAAYQAKLNRLDENFRTLFASCEKPTLVFGDHFPFRYFAEDYHLTCFAAFPGCNAASEPSPKTVTFLIEKIRTENITTVFYIENGTHTVADRIAAESGAVTALLHSCHTVTAEERQNGVTYLSLMQQNLETLTASLAP